MPLQTGGSEASATSSGPAPAPRRARAPRVLRWLLLGTLLLAVVVGVCAVLMVRDAFVARDALDDAAQAVPEVEQSLRDGLLDPQADGPALAENPALADLQGYTETAREATDGPLWHIAAYLPVVGPSVGAATTVASALDDVSGVVLPALAATGDAARATTYTADGRLELGPLAGAADDVTAARGVLTEAQAEVAEIDIAAVQPEFVDPVTMLSDQLGALGGLLEGAERATTLLPPMLGADEPRRYVLMSLTNAELRTAGGIPGALMLLEVDGGRVEVTRQVTTGEVGPFAEPVVELDPADVEAYSARLGRFVQDVTLTPDFATTGPITAEMWRRAQGEEVDGVLATDPVALSLLLEVTGPVDVRLPRDLVDAVGERTITLESSTVVDLLLRRAYEVLTPEQTDVFFAVVAGAVVEELTTTQVAPADLLPALEWIAERHRLLVWSADEEEQELLTGTLVSGTFAADRAADAVGMFLDDARIGKMTAYLDVQVELTGSECTAEGRLDTVSMRLENTLSDDQAATLPFYVAGPEDAANRGRQRVVLSTYGARDAGTPDVRRDGNLVGGTLQELHGRQVVGITVALDPGESTTIEATFPTTAAAARGSGTAEPGTLEVWSTPTATSRGLHVPEVPVCDG
ncbi:hypothetical protein GCM10023216_24110 [Isoptericola chiayiensis]|uniref:DUF4012 domain-containing protein n=1 Tax=Isoptericola chiayiensis TaxID=579446 RepID=A0ABP8YM39_9MICO|nr:DUF4012 domain-containing protein [Isoptericola chiayiensis]NOV99645.1 hypothetical protein [Isoptericola chiayiensis]